MKKIFLSLLLLWWIFSQSVFWYSQKWIDVLKDKYNKSLDHMIDWWTQINKVYWIQNWYFLWNKKDEKITINSNWEEVWWYTEIEWFWIWNLKNWRFLSTRNSLVVDSFLEWWFYRLNVWWNNYSFINSFYIWNKQDLQQKLVIKSFLNIDQSFQSFSWWDWLLNYLKRNNLKTKYLWFWFLLETPINKLWISSYEFNNALETYLNTWNNKKDLISSLNTKEINQYQLITIQVWWKNVNVKVIPFQKNPYFNIDSFNDIYSKVWVYKSTSWDCWTYKSDLLWNWTKLVNLYDYDSYINNCWSKNRWINEIVPWNYEQTFSSLIDLWNQNKWLYLFSVMNINQLLFWSSFVSNSNINEWFSINYWFSFTNENTEIFEAFKWKFTTKFLEYLDKFDLQNNDFQKLFISYSNIWKIFELTDNSDHFWNIKDKETIKVIQENNKYWHYRNIKDLNSVSENSILKILWKNWITINTRYTYWILNNDFTIFENLWNSDWINERWYNINEKKITDDCINTWKTKKDTCVHSSFVNYDLFWKNWSWIQKYLNASNIFHTIKWVNWKDLFQWTYSTWKKWLDYDKLWVWMWSKTWVKQWFVFDSLNEYLWHIWDINWTNNLEFWWEVINKLKSTEIINNKKIISNLTHNWKHYWIIWNYLLSNDSDYSWHVTTWWSNLWLYSLEWTKWWTIYTANINTTTVTNDDLWKYKVNEQNWYWYYEFKTQWIYQNWIYLNLYTSHTNHNEKWLVFWLNWLWIQINNDRKWLHWDVFPSYFMKWKKYFQEHFKWKTFEINNWLKWAWIFTTWNMIWDQYIISYDKSNILSSKDDLTDKYTTTKFNWDITWELKNAVLENFVLNVFWNKFWLDVSTLKKKDINWHEYWDINLYIWNKNWNLNIFFEWNDLNWNTWLLPIQYNSTNWVVKFFNKIKKQNDFEINWKEKFLMLATDQESDISLRFNEYSTINFDKYNSLYNQTFETFSDEMYYYKVKDENYFSSTIYKKKLFDKVKNYYTTFLEWTPPAWWEQIWELPEYSYFSKHRHDEYYVSEKFVWSVTNIVWLTREFYQKNNLPYDLHKMWWKIDENNTIYSWFWNLFLVSIYDEKPQYITTFDNKEYLKSPWNRQIISNIYWEWWQILESLDEDFQLNKFNRKVLKEVIENSQLKSKNYYHAEYKLNNKTISNKDFTTDVISKYKIRLIANFEEITDWTIKTEYQSNLNKYVTTRFVCWWNVIWTWKNITIKNLDLSDWDNLKNCNIEILVKIQKEWDQWSLWKLSWQNISVKTNFFTKKVVWWKTEIIDLWEKENKFVLNDVTMLSSLPYDSIQTIPNCKVIVKNKDTIDTWSWITIANSTSLQWKYTTLEIDVLYKNPKITVSWSWDKTLKWVVIDLWISWNWKFENYWSEYFNNLSNIYKNNDHLSDVSKEFLNEIKNNSIFTDKKIQYFVWASHYKRTQFFWKTTFYIKSSTPNLNQFLFNLQWSCTFKYFWWSDIKKPLEWAFSFKHTVDKNTDFWNLEYYNVDWRDRTLFSTWFSKTSNFWNEYLVKQYQPSILSLSYIHNWSAENINNETRIDKNNSTKNWEWTNWVTWWISNANQWRWLITNNNSPYNWTKWSWDNQSWYWFSLINLVNWYQLVSWRENYKSRSRTRSERETWEDVYETENKWFDFKWKYHNCSWDAKTKNTVNSSRKNWIDWKTWQAFWWYYQLRFDWYFSIWLKQVWTEWIRDSLVVDRILPYCMWNNISTRYWSKLLNLWWWNKLFVIDTLSWLNSNFINPWINQMIWSWCILSSNNEIEILTTKHDQKNNYDLKWKKSLDKNNWFPFFFSSSTSLENQLPQAANDVQKIFNNNVKINKNKLIKLYVTEELKKEIENVTLKLKINNWDLTSSNTSWKVKINYELTFNLKHKDKTRPNHVKNNQLYKLLDEWNQNKTLFDLQLPLLSISSFNESYSQNETSLINKLMIKWSDTITKEVVKTSPIDNFSIQWKYKKFVVSEYRTWKNKWRLRYVFRESCSKRRPCKRRYTCSIRNEWTYSDWSFWKVHQYVWWLNPTLYNLKNQTSDDNIISTFFQYTDSLWEQIANKTLMINWIPSIKNIWSNQILFEWLCDVCWSFQWNIFENQSVWMFNSKVVLNKQWTTNIFKYYEDPRYFEMKKSNFWLEWSKNFQLNWILSQDKKDWSPYVDFVTIHNNWIPEITPQWVWELWWATYYEWKKAVLIKWSNYKSPDYKPQPLLISSDILPKWYEKFKNWEKIEDELVIASDWDIIIWPDVTLINAVLMTKWNLIILNWNNSLKIHWWTVVQWRVYNYRININDINTKSFWDNYNKLYKNVELFNLKYPVLFTIDQRYLNSKIFNFVETVYRSTSR